ncbi:MAG TPA: ABC transporter permease [Trebonia sp.]|jgi:peptide/nickel transport system permease protein|nr:ABC transporter permease [Trebonia sp.]
MRLARRLTARVLTSLGVIWLVASATFVLVRLMPGDPVAVQYETDLSRGMSPAQARAAAAMLYGFVPRQPLARQYLHYLGQIAHLNLGQSITYEGVPVTHVIAAAAPWTVILVVSGILISFALGASAGVLAAMHRSSPAGKLLSLGGSVLHGIPQFVLAVLLAYVFTTLWAVLPFGAPYDATVAPGWNLPFAGSLVTHAILPVAAYALSGCGGWLLTTRSSVVSTLGDDFVLAAELRGLRRRTVARYIARNAMLPLFTLLALAIGFMFSGSVFIEATFDYPGLGSTLLASTGQRDYPLMTGTFLIITAMVITANLLADLAYGIIDPRLRRS